jgi:L-lactate dehydrogenase complex protein LldE
MKLTGNELINSSQAVSDGERDVSFRRNVRESQIALMIPCYIDLFYPEVGIATLELLEKLKVDVVYPFDQTCCGQPMANSGCFEEARATEELFIKNFSGFDYIVAPSGSCTHHLRNKFTAAPDSPERRRISANVYDLVEFLHDVLQVREFPWAKFGHKVALHTSCSAIRGLGMASMSERVHDAKFSKPKNLLERVPGIQFVDFERLDECCGFGGTFSVTEEAVAAKMGYDKLEFIGKAGADYIISSDMSCLMHLQGCASRLGTDVKVLHIAQVLNGVVQ